jgi:hypothetical protein
MPKRPRKGWAVRVKEGYEKDLARLAQQQRKVEPGTENLFRRDLVIVPITYEVNLVEAPPCGGCGMPIPEVAYFTTSQGRKLCLRCAKVFHLRARVASEIERFREEHGKYDPTSEYWDDHVQFMADDMTDDRRDVRPICFSGARWKGLVCRECGLPFLALVGNDGRPRNVLGETLYEEGRPHRCDLCLALEEANAEVAEASQEWKAIQGKEAIRGGLGREQGGEAGPGYPED